MTSPKKAIDASKYDTDKAVHTHYLRNYEEYFRPLLDRDVRLLELGAADITHPEFGTPPQRQSRIREMRQSQSHLFVVKA